MARRTNISNARKERYGAEAGRRFQERSERSIGGDGVMPPSEPVVRGDDDLTRPDDAVPIDEVIERLSRDMSEAVNRAPSGDRDELRSYATELVREDTAASSSASSPPTRRAKLSFFAIAVWLALAGAVLSFLIPPVGIVCFFMAGVAAVLAAILGHGEAVPERTTDAERSRS